ncbi:hypothetical protein BGX20_008161 [Mortierella sp. AD010]|nr:hypothetical protein BGX20_008161 [Mortierella sp. AD010]
MSLKIHLGPRLGAEDPPRVLLIHAGGYSTRLPHVSARADSQDGIQVLDLKLALYLHLLESMPPGVFLTSADGIELFSSKLPFPSEPKPYTITALAHPSSTWIGSTHGVYLLQDPEGRILEDMKLEPKDQSALLLKCQQFLHKPSLGKMILQVIGSNITNQMTIEVRPPFLDFDPSVTNHSAAIFITVDVMQNTPNVIHNHSTIGKNDVVYTDSCYYFDPQTAKIMANTYKSLDAECDLEAWADILCFQDQFSLISTTSTTPSPHSRGRQIVKRAFQESGVELDVMVLNASKFYHLGTMQEFLEGTCTDLPFMAELNIRNRDAGIAIVGSLPPLDSIGGESPNDENKFRSVGATAHIHPPVYIENSSIPSSVSIHPHSIIVDSDLQPDAVVPRDTCIFTLQLQEHEFVTFTFSVKDDMKRAVGTNVRADTILQELKIFERVPITAILPFGNLPPPELTVSGLSLWTAPVFEIARTKQESICLALDRLDRIRRCLAEGEKKSERAVVNVEVGGHAKPMIVGWTSLNVAARRAREY